MGSMNGGWGLLFAYRYIIQLVLVASGVGVAAAWYVWRGQRRGLPTEMVRHGWLWALVGAGLGSRLWGFLWAGPPWPTEVGGVAMRLLGADPSWVGALMGGCLVGLGLAWRGGHLGRQLGDLAAPGLALCVALIFLGGWYSGTLAGPPASGISPWIIPAPDAQGALEPRLALALGGAGAALGLCLLLLLMEHWARPGQLFGWWLVLTTALGMWFRMAQSGRELVHLLGEPEGIGAAGLLVVGTLWLIAVGWGTNKNAPGDDSPGAL